MRERRLHVTEDPRVLLPVFEGDGSRPRVPWLCLGLAAVWVGVFAAQNGGVALPPERFGLSPTVPQLPGALTCFALHFDPIHLAVSLGALFLAGPALEDRWGTPCFGLFLAGALGIQAAVGVHHAVDPRPLLGASPALAGLVAAAALRFGSGGISWRWAFASGRPPVLWLPGFVLPALWLAGELALDASGTLDGTPPVLVYYRAHAAAAAFGIAMAGVIGCCGLEERWLRRRLRGAHEREIQQELARAARMRDDGRPDVAYGLLEESLDSGWTDPRLVLALLEAGGECGRQGDALARATRSVADAWTIGRSDDAARVWCRLVQMQPNAPLDTRIRFALAPRLAAAGHRREAALTLRGELRRRDRDPTPGTALRIADAARRLHTETAIEAARQALASDDLDARKRTRIEALIDELESDPAQLDELDLDAPPQPPPASGDAPPQPPAPASGDAPPQPLPASSDAPPKPPGPASGDGAATRCRATQAAAGAADAPEDPRALSLHGPPDDRAAPLELDVPRGPDESDAGDEEDPRALVLDANPD